MIGETHSSRATRGLENLALETECFFLPWAQRLLDDGVASEWLTDASTYNKPLRWWFGFIREYTQHLN